MGNLVEANENKKVLAILDEKIKDADLELKAVVKSLQLSKNKRKRAVSGDNKFHGWGSSEAKKTKTAVTDSTGGYQLQLDAAGASFGLTELDFVKDTESETDQTMEEPLLQVIFSQPMLRDLKKLETSQVAGITQIQPLNKAEKLPDSDQDDRGSHSPDSYGSSKENDPEIVNTVTTTIYKQSKVSSTKKKNNMKNPVLKAQLEVS